MGRRYGTWCITLYHDNAVYGGMMVYIYIVKDLFIFYSHVEICIGWKITAHFHHLVAGFLIPKALQSGYVTAVYKL